MLKPITDVRNSIEYALKTFGKPVAETLVQSYGLKYGPIHPDTIEAQLLWNQLTGLSPSPSPSTLVADIHANAPVRIANSRSSSEPRRRGRSVD
jgi:hypothetical protein